METRTIRGFFARAALFAMIATPVAAFSSAPAAQAAGEGSTYITEINWAGSGYAGAANTADQWIELLNATTLDRDLSVSPLVLEIAVEDELYTLNIETAESVVFEAGQYMIVHNDLGVRGSNIRFADSGILEFVPAEPLPALSSGVRMRVLDADTEMTLDILDAPEGSDVVPFAGRAATTDKAPASMARAFMKGRPHGDGTLASSWFTTNVRGANLVFRENQYATPGASSLENVELTLNPISPANSVIAGADVVLSGTGIGNTALKSTESVLIQGRKVGLLTKPRRVGVVPTSGPGMNFSATLEALDAGLYQFGATAVTPESAYSDEKMFTVSPDSVEVNYLVFASESRIPAPVITSPVVTTNAATTVISGTVDPMVGWVDVARNGQYYGSVKVEAGTFTMTAALLPNVVNTFAVVANAVPASDVSDSRLGYVASVPATVMITSDTIAPEIDATKLTLTSNVPGTQDTIFGKALTTEAGVSVNIYADEAKTVKIAGPVVVAADGSFALQNIGDNAYAKVYVVATDVAGNTGKAVVVTNATVFAPVGGLTGLTVSNQQLSSFTVRWTAVVGAVNYKARFRTATGTFTAPVSVCAVNSLNCAAELTLVGLSSDTQYVVSVAAVDQFGNISSYSEVAAATTAPEVVVTTPTEEPVAVPVVARAASRRTLQPAPAPVVTPTPSATPESGEVKSATTEEELNSSPWVFLGLLIIVLVLALLGYFYWFGGTSGEAALLAAKDKQDEEKKKTPPTSGGGGNSSNGNKKKW